MEQYVYTYGSMNKQYLKGVYGDTRSVMVINIYWDTFVYSISKALLRVLIVWIFLTLKLFVWGWLVVLRRINPFRVIQLRIKSFW